MRPLGATKGLRFVHAGRGAVATGFATTPAGSLATIEGDAAVRQSLLLLLATMPGERVMRPEYGCPLHRLVFQPLDDTTAGLAIHYVEQAVRRWEPRVEVLGVDAHPSPDDDAELVVVLDYRVRDTRRQDTLAVSVDLQAAT